MILTEPNDRPTVKVRHSHEVKEWKTSLFTFRAVPPMALQKEWWLFHFFRGVSLQDRVKNHSKRGKLQSKRVEDKSKKSCPSCGSSNSAVSLFYIKRVYTIPSQGGFHKGIPNLGLVLGNARR